MEASKTDGRRQRYKWGLVASSEQRLQGRSQPEQPGYDLGLLASDNIHNTRLYIARHAF
jgi:hypothetical protein